MVSQTGAKAIVSLDWSLSDNDNETAIDYYEITLMGTHSNDTIITECMTSTNQALEVLSYKYVLSEGNYTSVSIIAVDICGERSEPIQVLLTNTTTVSVRSNTATSDTQQSVAVTGAVLGVLLSISVVIAAALLITVIILAIRVHHHQGIVFNVGYSGKHGTVKLQ